MYILQIVIVNTGNNIRFDLILFLYFTTEYKKNELRVKPIRVCVGTSSFRLHNIIAETWYGPNCCSRLEVARISQKLYDTILDGVDVKYFLYLQPLGSNQDKPPPPLWPYHLTFACCSGLDIGRKQMFSSHLDPEPVVLFFPICGLSSSRLTPGHGAMYSLNDLFSISLRDFRWELAL